MKTHILIDIEALGRRPGAAIIEIGACQFFPEPGWVGLQFEARIEPQEPFTADLETLEWHRKQGTWPRPDTQPDEMDSIGSALTRLEDWIKSCGEVEAYWAWGATYDFPLLTAAYDFAGISEPWKYYQTRCARTIWQQAYGNRRHSPRPHNALKDAISSAVDLMDAMAKLEKSEND